MKYVTLLALVPLAGCVTTAGMYRVSATQADGSAVPRVITAQGSGIYTARNAFCAAYPGATVTIISATTGEEYGSESPYHCK